MFFKCHMIHVINACIAARKHPLTKAHFAFNFKKMFVLHYTIKRFFLLEFSICNISKHDILVYIDSIQTELYGM